MRGLWIALGVMAVVLVGYTVYSLVTAARAAQQFRGDAAALTASVRDLDGPALQAEVAGLSQSARDFSAAVSGPFWSVASALPVVGSTAGSIGDLGAAAVAAAQAAEELSPVLPLLSPEDLRGPDGRFDVAAMRRIATALGAAAPALDQASAAVLRADPGSIGPVGEAVVSAQSQLGALPQTAAGARTALDVGAELLGERRRQEWMILLQNGSEARGTGGFLGAYALLSARDGRIDVDEVDTNNSLSTRIPNGRMPAEFLEFWTPEYTSEWNSYNLSRHFPYTGELSRSGMAARGVELDSVMAMDAYGVAALLAGTGPISVGGESVSADNAVQYFNADIYTQYGDDIAAKDAAVVAFMKQLVGRVTDGDVDLAAVAAALPPLVDGQRLGIWAADPALQARIEPYSVAGVVPTVREPWVTVALNNSAGNKLDAFVASDVTYRSGGACGRVSEVSVTLTNNAPAGGVGEAYADAYYPASSDGATRMWTTVYGPVASTYVSAEIDGRRQFVNEGRERRHPVWRWNLDLPRGESSELVVRFREPAVEGVPTIWPQAMAVPQSVSASSLCAS